jgi:hypothetical protein
MMEASGAPTEATWNLEKHEIAFDERRRHSERRPMTIDGRDPDIRREHDFSDGVRGKYADRFAEGFNVVVLDPDVAAEFKTRKAVNDALRAQLKKGRRATGDDR